MQYHISQQFTWQNPTLNTLLMPVLIISYIYLTIWKNDLLSNNKTI